MALALLAAPVTSAAVAAFTDRRRAEHGRAAIPVQDFSPFARPESRMAPVRSLSRARFYAERGDITRPTPFEFFDAMREAAGNE